MLERMKMSLESPYTCIRERCKWRYYLNVFHLIKPRTFLIRPRKCSYAILCNHRRIQEKLSLLRHSGLYKYHFNTVSRKAYFGTSVDPKLLCILSHVTSRYGCVFWQYWGDLLVVTTPNVKFKFGTHIQSVSKLLGKTKRVSYTHQIKGKSSYKHMYCDKRFVCITERIRSTTNTLTM